MKSSPLTNSVLAGEDLCMGVPVLAPGSMYRHWHSQMEGESDIPTYDDHWPNELVGDSAPKVDVWLSGRYDIYWCGVQVEYMELCKIKVVYLCDYLFLECKDFTTAYDSHWLCH